MTNSKLCENFNAKFVDLIRKLEYPPELEKYLKYFENEDFTILSVNLFNSDDNGKFAFCSFISYTSEGNKYYYQIHFSYDYDVCITIYYNDNKVFREYLKLNGFKWDFLFIPQQYEENTSEPEQTPSEENKQAVEFTFLEKSLFEEFFNLSNSRSEFLKYVNDDYSLYGVFTDVLRMICLDDLISNAGLNDKYHIWLDERRK